jgi:hypothetical protein
MSSFVSKSAMYLKSILKIIKRPEERILRLFYYKIS